MNKPIHSITPFTLLDFPDKTACILWFAGCNMKCLYCYNPGIVLGKGKHSYADALQFLSRRKQLLDGVVLSGGECTSHKELPAFCHALKSAGLLVKIDTNGSNPQMMANLLAQGLVDYVALDYKAPADKYAGITQSSLYTKFEETLQVLMTDRTPFEIRTTVHTSLLNEEDLQEMVDYLTAKGFKGKLYIQHFINDTMTLGRLDNTRNRVDPRKVMSNCIELILRN
ncbi:anaerobic ribonucleoside-triphosphate reductase activating protein [Chitinophaga sancti]|uniref:Anaerobic ribonucleoside-triphosphate reductase activating protein n=2 Tax=Chitinophaga sancti TaxID=1004 RepID=A0ABZ0XNE9_9BACT|nr:anaerobic ribonucleoside-triphosphate reductase activating protein [Chitinophaga sancti]WQD62270.1 anaerobic ribonucleoside-triphosphate reductase activating protein [Chitinophaga sancti]WQG92161.1 anaerobic ribonucleoside-triphosphate reductase activating protein [Chitinophaga sancti]